MIRNGKNGLPPETVGEVVWQALTVRAPRTRYAVVGRGALQRFVQQFLPKRLIDRIVARTLGLERQNT